MFIINKRRLFIIFTCLIISTIGLEIARYSHNKEQTQATVALPVSNKVIILDAGHGRRRWRSCC